MTGTPPSPFRLPAPPGLGWLATLAERALGLAALEAGYRSRPPALDAVGFLDFALQRLGLRASGAAALAAAIPARGPLIVYANHPHGGAEGMLLAQQILGQRTDLKILANALLLRVPEMAPLIIPVNVFQGGVNRASLRQALAHLQSGGALLLFPAGEVSRWHWRAGAVQDPPWPGTLRMLAVRSDADVLPVHIGGRASLWSLCLGALHPRLRTLWLARNLLTLRRRALSLQVGDRVAARTLGSLPQPVQTPLLRLLVDRLAEAQAPRRPNAAATPLITAADPAALAAEIAGLPAAARLLRHGEFEVWMADAARLPQVLPEIGRLRELSFRAVDEGSGLACDLDAWDAHYQHLFIWAADRRCIVGAYRIGDVQQIVAEHGLSGLYTHSLFHYDRRLLARLGPALEMGRSFVAPDFQRSFQPLRLLWAGIAELLRRRPELGWLFGPVSVPPGHGTSGRALLQDALLYHHGDRELAALVRPRRPLPRTPDSPERLSVIAGLGDPARLSRVLSLLGDAHHGLPVLVRQYLELNGRFAGFHVDESFGGSLDGLVFVKVTDIPERVMARMVRLPSGASSGVT
ncbi:MAG: lysophospholipid acyltransferase family protein [Polycyclovorans sp.]|jgi:putative hemolysin